MAPDGTLLCCDVSEEWTAIAREGWKRGGVDDRIELKIAPAIETLRALPAEPAIDLAFIDADKPSYAGYYEEILTRLRPNGVILVDNTLWSGAVIDKKATDDNTKAIRAFNDMVAADPRVDCVIIPLGDGLTFLRKNLDAFLNLVFAGAQGLRRWAPEETEPAESTRDGVQIRTSGGLTSR